MTDPLRHAAAQAPAGGAARPVITVAQLCKDFSGEKALKGIDLSVPRGSLYGLIGADGAGKSTLLQILTTLIRPDSGSAAVLDLDIRKDASAIRTRIGYMPQKFSLYHDLTVMENLAFFADIFGVRGSERVRRIERLLAFARLQPFTKRRAGNLSGGMKQKLALSCALVHEPELLLLDEPTIGVDPASRREFWSLLRELTNSGHSILVSTPYMDETAYCDRLSIMHQGRVIREGEPATLLKKFPQSIYRVIEPAIGELSFPPDAALPEGITQCYYAGGGIRVVAHPSMPHDRVGRAVTSFVVNAAGIEPQAPEMEDVFIELLNSDSTADGVLPTKSSAKPS
jgi:ABC-2 type transport system ATP-binding protein